MNFKQILIGTVFLSFSMGCQQQSGSKSDESQAESGSVEPTQDVQSDQTQTQTTKPPQRQSQLNDNAPNQIPNGQSNLPEAREVKDEELQNFVQINLKAQELNQKAQNDMVLVIQEEGLDVQRYSEIAQAEQNPQSNLELSPEESEKYQKIVSRIQGLQGDFQKEMQVVFSEYGMTEQEMQELSMLIQQDQELMARFQQIQSQLAAPQSQQETN